MEKEFVPYEVALRLKALGFDEPCFGCYLEFDEFLNIELIKNQNSFHGQIASAPTYSQVFRWFRDNYGLSGWVNESFVRDDRQGVISVKSEKGLEYISTPRITIIFKIYEEAELACLEKLLEIVESKS